MANDTFPVPVGSNIRETYGKVISGKMNDDIVRMAFMTKLSFRDFCWDIVLPFEYELSSRHNVLVFRLLYGSTFLGLFQHDRAGKPKGIVI